MARVVSAGLVAGLLWTAAAFSPAIAQAAAPTAVRDRVPDFAPNGFGWNSDGENEFTPPKSGPGPVTSDPAHPCVSNFVASRTGAAANWRVDDTLVVDTIGMNDKSFVDSYRTPHTTALHVVERFKLVDGGRALEVNSTVDHPGAFNMLWSGGKRWKRVRASLREEACAENNADYFNYAVEPMPQAGKPDF